MAAGNSVVVLRKDLPEHGLRAGDVGTVVHAHPGGRGFEVEFATLKGRTIALVTLRADDLRAVARTEIASARRMD